MRLTSSSFSTVSRAKTEPSFSPWWAAVIVIGGLAAVFALDRGTGDAPVQHLYYLPIAFAAVVFGHRGGLLAAFAAIALYHLANGLLYDPRRSEADIVQVALFIAVGIVVARLAADAERLRRLASTDDLTGLHNLRSFEARLAALLRAARAQRAPLSLLVLDLDRLKSLNDRYSHLAGAEAVRTVGEILAIELPPEAVACRYGGDEFVVALPGCTAAQAEDISAALGRAVHAAVPVLAGHDLPAGTLSISIGVACRSFVDDGAATHTMHSDAEEGEALFRAADDALYRAKADGRNRVCSAGSARPAVF
jgi:diguanylate cyclase (GGDEF)-like protein